MAGANDQDSVSEAVQLEPEDAPRAKTRQPGGMYSAHPLASREHSTPCLEMCADAALPFAFAGSRISQQELWAYKPLFEPVWVSAQYW